MSMDSEGEDHASENTRPSGSVSRDRISDALKQAYDDVANAPLPDRLSTLLEQLKDRSAQ